MKFRIRQNVWDNWYGYAGRQRVIAFTNGPYETMKQAAERWLAERTAGGAAWPQEAPGKETDAK